MQLLPLLLLLAVSAAASAVPPSEVCKPVSAAYASKGLDVLHVQYQASAAHLGVCTQRRPTCCTRAMEEALQAKAKVEMYQMLYQQLVPRSTALASLVTGLQSLFLNMLNVSHQDLDMNLKSIYGYSYIENKQPFTVFFDQLRAYVKGGSDTMAEVTRTLFENIAARVYVLIMTNYDIDERYLTCVKRQLNTLRPLGQVPDRVGQEFTRAFVTARRFTLGLAALQEAVESAPAVRLSEGCQRARLRSQYCGWCDGHPAMPPCYGLCAAVIADCLAPLDSMAEPFNLLVGELARLTDKVEGPNNFYQVLHQLGLRISGGIMDMQERKENFQTQIAKSCGQPRLKVAGVGGAAHPAMPPPLQPPPRRARRSSELFGWSYRGKDEPAASGGQQVRLAELVRVARQELLSVRGLFRWSDGLARANCRPDVVGPTGRCWNGTDPAAAYAPPPAGVAAAPAPAPEPSAAAAAANLRSVHRMAADLPRSDNFADFREQRLDAGLSRLLMKRATVSPSLPVGGGGALPGGPVLVDAGGDGSGSGASQPPVRPPQPPPPRQPGQGGEGLPLRLSTLPPLAPPRTPHAIPDRPPPALVDVDAAAGSGDSSAPPPSPFPPSSTGAGPAVAVTARPTAPPPPAGAATTTAGRPPIDLAGSGDEQPPASSEAPPRPPIFFVPTAAPGGGVGSGDGELPPSTDAPGVRPPWPSRRPPQPPPFEPPGGGTSGGELPPPPPLSPWTPEPPPARTPRPPQPPLPQPDSGTDLWLPKEPDEQGGAERNRGEGSIYSPMKMTDTKRACPPGAVGPACPACRPAAASACALLLFACLQRLLLLRC